MRRSRCTAFKKLRRELVAAVEEALVSNDPKAVFEALFAAPLRKVSAPEAVLILVIDALDEMSKEGQKPVCVLACHLVAARRSHP